MSADSRLAKGGLVERGAELKFAFDGKQYLGLRGDTLASALLANGVKLVGRSFKYHRPRGIFSAGSEEPNALVTMGKGDRLDPNTKATAVELYDGLSAKSQNRFPTLKYDWMAINDLFSPFLGAGFYYKTFMWPASFWERIYEPLIRRAAGLGALSGKADPDIYEKCWAHCDLLVIGSGPAGLMSALLAARSGARVILCEEDFLAGGRLNSESLELARTPGNLWAANIVAELASMDSVRILTRTGVFGCFDGGTYGAVERVTDHIADPRATLPRQRLWRIVTKTCILASGAVERGMAFPDNDRPGIMLASAARSYVNRFAVSPGQNVVVYSCNDNGWLTAHDLIRSGVGVEAIVDPRPAEDVAALRELASDVPVFTRAAIVETTGRHGVRSVTINREGGKPVTIETDCVAVSGGWNPTVHLTCHHGGKPVWSDRIAGFIPGADLPPGMLVAGAAAGAFSTHAALTQGLEQGRAALEGIGLTPIEMTVPDTEDQAFALSPVWHVEGKGKRAWLDLQNDVTVKDVSMSRREGFGAIEHVKRYTTLGMGTDQGKTVNTTAIGVLASLSGQSVGETGTTVYRPPFSPAAVSVFAGRATGMAYRPLRLTPSHDWAKENNAVFTEAGLWLRAQWFRKRGEKDWRQSCDREALSVRKSVGVCDVSTLGKIDVKGKDAGEFLDRVYANMMSTLKVGKVRYGLMLREDGFVMDDGTVARLAQDHFLITTTTGNAGLVMQHVDFCAQAVWPELETHMVSVTDQYAQFAVAGPNARKVLEKLVDHPDQISNEALPYMGCLELRVCGGVPARLFRISFSGELGYELAVPAGYGDALVRAVARAGASFDITPYGLEALNVLRIEKGHPVAAELNGQTTAGDLGLGRMMSSKKDFIGRVMAGRPALVEPDRMVLAGFRPVDVEDKLTAGAHFIGLNRDPTTENDQGWMSSVCHSPSLGHSIGLGFIRRGAERHGETVRAVDAVRGKDVKVEICSPQFVDPEAERVRV